MDWSIVGITVAVIAVFGCGYAFGYRDGRLTGHMLERMDEESGDDHE